MRTPKLLLAALFLCATIPAAAQLTDTYVITAAANLEGGNHTKWLTQLSLFNPHFDHTLKVSVTLLPTGGATGPEKLIELPPNSTFLTDDLLGDVFHVSGGGALLIATFPEDNPGVGTEIIDRAFLVTSNTYNNSSNGTYGQTIPGVWAGLLDYDSDEISAIAHGIDNSSRLKFRTNVGAVNLGRCEVNVLVSAYDADGAKVLNERALRVPPLAHIQDRLPVDLEGGSVEFFVSDPCANDTNRFAVVFPYTSTIDDLSGDPKYQTPTLLASPSVIFGKKATMAAIDPTQLGKRIDSAYARAIRNSANRLGTVHLVRGERGLVVAE
ncbi:MAG: hypothetical protein ABI779_01390 [Acidobacteriota bacterium]